MMKHKKATAVLLSLLLLLLCAFPCFAVTGSTSSSDSSSGSSSDSGKSSQETSPVTEILASYNNPNGRVLSVAKGGDFHNYPEDSLVAIEASMEAGADIISVSVQETKDNQLVLLEDDTLDRMLIARDSGSSASGKVSSYTLSELQTNFYLRQGRGGSQSSTTKTAVASLKEVIEATKGNCMLLISNGFEYAAAINALARSADACDTIIIGGATDPAAVSTFLSENDSPVCHFATRYQDKTNKTKVKDFTTQSLKSGADLILYEPKSSSSAVFKSSNLKLLKDSGRAMISVTEPTLCGNYRDMQTDWEALIDMGFSVIETNYPEPLVEYLKLVEYYRADMTQLITEAQSLNTVNYNRSTKKAIKQALEPAVELSSIGALSLSRTLEVHYNLQSVMDSIATTGSAKYHSKTKWWVVLLILLVVLVLLFCGAIFGLRFFNKRKSAAYKKRQRFKNRFKAQAEANLNELAERLPDEEEFPDEPRTEAEAVAAEAARKEQESLSRKLNLKMQAGKAVFDQKTSARKKESAEKKEERAVKKAERQAAKEAAKAEKAAKAAERAALDAENAAETFGTDNLPGHDAGTPDHTAPISFVSLDVPDPTTPAEPSEEVLPTAPVSEEEQSVIH